DHAVAGAERHAIMEYVITLEITHTADLEPATLAAARAFLAGVFEGDFTEHDWEHALGGMHAIAWDGDEIVGHASLIQRRLLHGGHALRCGYVEGVGVAADRRRHGIGGAVMEPLERMIRAAYDLGALGGTDEAAAFYRSRGWEVWRGPLSALTPEGVRP